MLTDGEMLSELSVQGYRRRDEALHAPRFQALYATLVQVFLAASSFNVQFLKKRIDVVGILKASFLPLFYPAHGAMHSLGHVVWMVFPFNVCPFVKVFDLAGERFDPIRR